MAGERAQLFDRVASFLGGRGHDLPAAAPALTVARRERPAALPFSEFVTEHLEDATRLAGEFMGIADARQGESGFADVMDAAEAAAADRDPALVRHALKLFMTHSATGRLLRIPSLLSRYRAAPSLAAAEAQELPALLSASGSSPPEQLLDWFREDPLANEHHEHWHLVYDRLGIPDGAGGRRLQERHGELFFYMHQQMLARYDAERLAIEGLDLVRPLDDYRAPIAEGYDPGGLTIEGTTYVRRESGTRLSDLTVRGLLGRDYSVGDHERRRDRFFEAAESASIRIGAELRALEGHAGSDLLGATNETSIGSVSGLGAKSFYGNHHGFGHVLIALADPAGLGVIWNTASAIRDPAFWRWHRHIDDISFAYQETQPPHDFAVSAPAAAVKDVYLVPEGGWPALPQGDDGIAAFAAAAFGASPDPANWDRLFAPGSHQVTFEGAEQVFSTTGELLTEMRLGRFEADDGRAIAYPYLTHHRFDYVLRVENTAETETRTTVRIFLGPTDPEAASPDRDAIADNRRYWIEMDKFRAVLAPGEKRVLVRHDTDSSVIRRPIVDPGDVRDVAPDEEDTPDTNYCECGWPHHLLLPRGTRQGMAFRLFVMLTDWDDDQVPEAGHCGSMSFCGARDRYPDRKPMGFPFDRRLPAPVAALVEERPNMSLTPITIRCANI